MEDVAMAERPAPATPAAAATPAAPAPSEEPAPPATPPASGEPFTLEDVEDDNFEGEPITLGDDSVTSDEIATMTLADIYATQGYASRALKIYREVQKRQPDNRTLVMKIDALEKELAKVRAAEREEAVAPERPVAETAPALAQSPPPAPAASESNDASAASRPAPPTGHPIDPSRNYEQFKRWLKASSR
jgi:hypothetical protein